MKRREFLAKSLAGGAALAAFPLLGAAANDKIASDTERNRAKANNAGKGSKKGSKFSAAELEERYALLDDALHRPVFRKDLFPEPVIIESLEILEYRGQHLMRVRSRDGAEGLAVCHALTGMLMNILRSRVLDFFIGQDARELDALLEWIFIYRFNFRLNGQAVGLPIADIEFAILDMMGRIAGRPAAELIGGLRNREFGIYYATELRDLPLEEHFRRIVEEVSEFDVKALKIRVGYQWEANRDIHYKGMPGKSEKLVPMVREHFGPDWDLYADANGYYDAEGAIAIGRLMEEYDYGYFEEPVMYNHFEDIKRVSDALSMPVANGEQDQSFYNYRWLLANDGLDIVEPDLYYFGGFIRCMRVAMMADAFGKECLTHMSGGGLGYVYNALFVSALPNPTTTHEFKNYETHVPFVCPTSPLKVVKGKMQAPTGPGLGVEIDPDWVAKHRVL